MNGKTIKTLLLALFILICVTGMAACNAGDNDGDKGYTVTWKNYDGEVLELDENVKAGAIPTYDGATPVRQGDELYSYVFSGWSPAISAVAEDTTYTAKFTVRRAGELIPGVDPVFSADNETVEYGFYPQTYVNDETTIAELNSLTPSGINGWYLYNGAYYVKETAKVFSGESYTFDDGTAIVNGNEYWFKCDIITWQVLCCENGSYYLISDKLLDAQAYYADYTDRTADGKTVYANNYGQSDIRSWLNNDFYNAAFALNDTCVQEKAVNNGASGTETEDNRYVCNDTSDKVYLPSYRDYLNPGYGFDSDAAERSSARECRTTDYARARGAWYNAKSSFAYNGSYWTRSPSSQYYYCAWNVNSGGYLSEYAVDGDSHCVRPCISLYFPG